MKSNIGAGDFGKTKILSYDMDKTSPLVALIGQIDELNSFLGFSRSLLEFKDLDEILKEIQNHLFLINSELAGASLKTKVSEKEVKWLEEVLMNLDKEVKPLSNFIYPTGSIPSSSLQVARAICRRVERMAFRFSKRKRIVRNEILAYLNRLSDVLFMMARVVNKRMKVDEEVWKIEE